MSDSDDEPLQLSSAAMAALQEFYAEQQVKLEAANKASDSGDKEQMPSENWQLSQFWYSDATALALAEEALREAGPNGRIACVACPTAYHKLRSIKPESCTAVVLEFDDRFRQYGEDFIFYDYNQPLQLPETVQKQSFDVVLADPPFLAEECLLKTAETVKFLTHGKVLLCTGRIMGELAEKLLGVHECLFKPQHENNLANEFRCFVNYESRLDDASSLPPNR